MIMFFCLTDNKLSQMFRTSKFTDTSDAYVVRVTESNKWHIYDMSSK